MLNDTTNNYLKACESWRLKFLNMDKQQLLEKLPEIKIEADYLSLKLFGRKFGIHTQTGEIVTLEDFQPAEIISQLNIYTLLGFASPQASLTDKWVPFRELSGASPFTMAFEKHVLEPFALTFSEQTEKLSKACEVLGGVNLSHSDVGYRINAFDCMPIKFLFWDGDDEFPAQANILYDSSATDFIHVESTVSIAIEGIERLAEAAGIEIKGPIFKM
ncbi:MAG: DUF3786 domain-containing protein [Acetobacterium sp.]|nr:DUF3786 domain-containing protein [Bacillota bacterium]MCG2730937.1 DUF3786 domain-containing protein [Acetobacterium sp.]